MHTPKYTKGKLMHGMGKNILDSLRDERGNLVATTSGTNTMQLEVQEANAARLAHCWNCFDEMKEALEVVSRLDYLNEHNAMAQIVRHAITLARGDRKAGV